MTGACCNTDNQTSWLPEVQKALKYVYWMFHKAENALVFPAEEQKQGFKLGAICQLRVIGTGVLREAEPYCIFHFKLYYVLT